MVFSCVDTSPAVLFSSVFREKNPCAAAVGRVGDEMQCVDILAGGDDDGRSVIADDPEATPPVAPEEAEGLVVEREEAVVATDDH